MVQELRRIILDTDELILSLDAFRRVSPGFLPDGRITGLKIADHGGVIVTIADARSGQFRNVTVPEGRMREPIIRFCIENNIMLPRGGRKSVLATKDNISLCVVLDSETIIANSVAPVQSTLAHVAHGSS